MRDGNPEYFFNKEKKKDLLKDRAEPEIDVLEMNGRWDVTLIEGKSRRKAD